LSVGIESGDDLVEDVVTALEAAARTLVPPVAALVGG
jgi:hypothetical protein